MARVPRAARGRRRPLDRVWIVVADGGQARVLGITGDRRGLTVLREMASVEAHRRARDLASEPRGRGPESGFTTRRAVAPRQGGHDEARLRFIGHIAHMLNGDNRARQFDELILIVPAGLGAAVRDRLNEATRARVRETLLQDLTKAPLHDILKRLVETGLLPAPDTMSSRQAQSGP